MTTRPGVTAGPRRGRSLPSTADPLEPGIDAERRELDHPVSDALVRHAPARLRPGVSLIVRTVDESLDDRIVGLAAEVAFFTILSLPPLLLATVAALGFLPGDQSAAFVDGLVAAARRVFTFSTVENVIRPILEEVAGRPRTDALSIGFAISLVAASRAVRVVFTAVTIAYDLEAKRPGWKHRVYGLLATLAVFVVVPVLLPALLAGPGFGQRLVRDAGLPAIVGDVWGPAYWIGVGVGTVIGVAVLYHLAAPWWTPFRRDLPGAVLAVTVWFGSSAGLRSYTTRTIVDNDLYQVLAGPLALLLWLYVLAFGVLLGAELNAELERQYPSPEQQRAPAAERLRRRILDSDTATRVRSALPSGDPRTRDEDEHADA